MEEYDVIVVGAGVEGSATAYQLAKSGKRVLLLEQYKLGHERGSSHGSSRITRKAYPEAYYARMMGEAYSSWADLEQESNQKLFLNCGLLNIGKKTGNLISSTKQSMDAIQSPYELLSSDEIRRKYPTINVGDEFYGLYDGQAGMLKADVCLRALQSECVKRGGVIKDEEPVVAISPGQEVTITTQKAKYKAKALIITAGPWTNKLTEPLGIKLPLKIERINVFYWRQKVPGHEYQNFPTLILNGLTGRDRGAYALPAYEHPGLFKLCLHDGEEDDPDNLTNQPTSDPDEKCLAECITKYFPGIEPKATIKQTCMYSITPDHDYIIDRHPRWSNIAIGAGFSGHGFKLAPVVGRLLSQLVQGQTPTYDLSHFKISRFDQKAKL